jgi:hypothetical protein
MVKRRIVLALAAITIAVVGIGIVEERASNPAQGPSCPTRARHVHPSNFHFTPGLGQHQSWIDFAISEPDATSFQLCLDGRLWESGIGETPQAGRVSVNVNTSFVDAEWLLGQLAGLQDPQRWELHYTTYTIENG